MDRQYSLDWREGKGLREFDDMFGGTVTSRSYEAYSVVPAYSEDGLRDTDQVYPGMDGRALSGAAGHCAGPGDRSGVRDHQSGVHCL